MRAGTLGMLGSFPFFVFSVPVSVMGTAAFSGNYSCPPSLSFSFAIGKHCGLKTEKYL